mgnify:FL=1
MSHRQDVAETNDDKAWEPPEQNIVATAYFKPESVRFEIPNMETVWIEADGAYNLSDMT